MRSWFPLLSVVLGLGAPALAGAQARRLSPEDFIVAGIPDDYDPAGGVEADTLEVLRALGRPDSIGRHEFQPGDTFSTWHYRGLVVEFGTFGRHMGVRLTSARFATRRGLRVGDPADRVVALYGPRVYYAEEADDEWVYRDPRERLHVIVVTVRQGQVVQVYLGTLWD